METFDKALVEKAVEYAIEEYEGLAPYGADISNGLDIAMYNLFENEEDEPKGLYEHVLQILKDKGYN